MSCDQRHSAELPLHTSAGLVEFVGSACGSHVKLEGFTWTLTR